MPKVSVVMAVHNGMPFLPAAVGSILAQGFRDFEFIIIDDASNDGSVEWLQQLADDRIRLLRNESRLGLTSSLNAGLDAARGDYVARMDHDDISLPTRIAEQVAFLEKHPRIDICGTWAKTIGRRPLQTWRYPPGNEEIRAEMLFASVLVHSSVMLRRATFERNNLRYDPQITHAQDYELWTRADPHVRFANLGKVLLRYRIHPEQVGEGHHDEQQKVAADVRLRQLRLLGLSPTQDELKLHNAISRWQFSADRQELERVHTWLQKLRAANRETQMYSDYALLSALEGRWWAACRAAISLGLDAWRQYRDSPLAEGASRSLPQIGRFYLKCWLREWGWKR